MKLNLIVFLFLISTALSSQSYYKLVKEGAIWNHYITDSPVSPFQWSVIDSTAGDTIIGFHLYKKVYKKTQGFTFLDGAVREDTNQQKVYFHDFVNELLLYDFTLKTGDTMFYSADATCCSYDYFKIVDSVNVINISGKDRKRWYFTNYFGNVFMPDIWIEGIGSVYRYGLLNPFNPDVTAANSTPHFGCFSNDSITFINTQNCSGLCPCTSWTVDVKQIENDMLNIYPNPANEFLILDLPTVKYDFAEFYNLKGELVFGTELVRGTNKININSLNNGFYFIKLIGNDVVSIRKFIKMNN